MYSVQGRQGCDDTHLGQVEDVWAGLGGQAELLLDGLGQQRRQGGQHGLGVVADLGIIQEVIYIVTQYYDCEDSISIMIVMTVSVL